jgi:hypothetical protein
MIDYDAKIPIQFKRSCTAGLKPSECELAEGELAINLADKIAYSKDCYGSIVPLTGGSGLPDTIDGGTYAGAACNMSAVSAGTTCLSSETFMDPNYNYGMFKNTYQYYKVGDLITVAARGCVSGSSDWPSPTGPDGYPVENNDMGLYGRMGKSTAPDIYPAWTLGTQFKIGSAYSQLATEEGYLWLWISDAAVAWDNSGNYCVSVSGGSRPLGDMTITSQPQPAVAVNGTASCSCTASASGAAITYTWQFESSWGGHYVNLADGTFDSVNNVWRWYWDASPTQFSSAAGPNTQTLTINGLLRPTKFRCVVSAPGKISVISNYVFLSPPTAP